MADPIQDDPYFRIKDMKKREVPVWEQYAEFTRVASEDPDWWNLSDEDKAKIYKSNFDIDNPRQIFEIPEAAGWSEDTLQRVTNAYLLGDRDFQQIQDQNQRQAIHQGLIDSFYEFHRPAREEAEFAGRIAAQEEAERLQDIERMKRETPVALGGDRVPGRVDVQQLEQFEGPTSDDFGPETPRPERDVGRLGETQHVYDAMSQEFPENPEKARLYGDSVVKLRMNQVYHAAGGAKRQEMVNNVMADNEAVEAMTPGQRVQFRHGLLNNDWLGDPHRDGYEAESAEGFWENVANEGARGVRQSQLAWNSSVEMALNELVGAGDERVMEDVKDISEAYSRLNKIPVSEAAKRVYSGDWTPDEYVSFLAQTTASSFVAFGPFLPAITAAGVGGPGAVAATSALSSGILEYGPSIIDFYAESGIDVSNPDELFKAITTNDSLKREAYDYAKRRAIPIAVVDGLTALVGAKFGAAKGAISRAAKRSGVKPPADWYKKAGVAALDAGGGGVGEILSQQWADGEITDWHGVIAEMAGELPTTIAEYGGGRVSAAKEGGLVGLENIGEDVAAGLREGVGVVPDDAAPAPSQFTGAANVTVDDEDGDIIGPGRLDQPQQEFFDTLSDEERLEIRGRAEEEFERRMDERMERYGLGPEEVGKFPENEMNDIEREAFADTLDAYKAEIGDQVRAETPPEAQKGPSKPAETKPGTPAPTKAAAAEPAPAPAPLYVKDHEPKVKAAQTIEELDALEAEWQENGNPKSTTMPKTIAAKRKQLELEAPAEVSDEELGVRPITGTQPLSELAEDSFVRWEDPEGKLIEGQVRHGEEGEQIAIEEPGGMLTYVDPDTNVGVLVDYTREAKPKPKLKKKAEKFAGSELSIDDWVGDYELELGETPTAKRLHDYLTAYGCGR
jgi:hypothetical protein